MMVDTTPSTGGVMNRTVALGSAAGAGEDRVHAPKQSAAMIETRIK
jgi:hypothetical protein